MGSHSDLLCSQDINHGFFLTTCGSNYVRREIKHFHSLPFSQFAKNIYFLHLINVWHLHLCYWESAAGFWSPSQRQGDFCTPLHFCASALVWDAHGHRVLFWKLFRGKEQPLRASTATSFQVWCQYCPCFSLRFVPSCASPLQVSGSSPKAAAVRGTQRPDRRGFFTGKKITLFLIYCSFMKVSTDLPGATLRAFLALTGWDAPSHHHQDRHLYFCSAPSIKKLQRTLCRGRGKCPKAPRSKRTAAGTPPAQGGLCFLHAALFLGRQQSKVVSHHPAHALPGAAQAAQLLPCYPDCINTKPTVTPAATTSLLSNNNQDNWQQQSRVSNQLCFWGI